MPPEGTGQLVLYRTEDGRTHIDVRLIQESVWLTLNQIADLFQRDKSVISKHIKNIFESGELDAGRTVAKFATVQTEGGRSVTREIEFYRLEVILAVGYRVKSARGTQFRQWATNQLEQYMVKGFAMDDERLKQAGGGDYFDELLGRIRDIRSSERVFWRKVLDIYATSVDYDPSAEAARGETVTAGPSAAGRLVRPPGCKLSRWSSASAYAREFVAEKSLAAFGYGRVPMSKWAAGILWKKV